MKWLPAHLVAKRLPRSVLFDILTKNLHIEFITGIKARIHAGKCSLLVSIPNLLIGVGRDNNVDAAYIEDLT